MTPFRGMNLVKDGTWELCSDNPLWGNNAEASSSGLNVSMTETEEMPRLQMVADEGTINVDQGNGGVLVPYDENFAVRQIMENLHPGWECLTLKWLI